LECHHFQYKFAIVRSSPIHLLLQLSIAFGLIIILTEFAAFALDRAT
jgi:hypothetical protein